MKIHYGWFEHFLDLSVKLKNIFNIVKYPTSGYLDQLTLLAEMSAGYGPHRSHRSRQEMLGYLLNICINSQRH